MKRSEGLTPNSFEFKHNQTGTKSWSEVGRGRCGSVLAMGHDQVAFCVRCGGRLESIQSEGRTRLACSVAGCGYVFYGNPLPVVAALLEHEGHIILVRNKSWPATWYGLVSGFLEAGETPEQAVLREVQEELGLSASIVSLVGVYPFFERNEVIVAYHVRASGEIRLGEELADYRVVPPEKLRPWSFGTGLAVAAWLEQRSRARPE